MSAFPALKLVASASKTGMPPFQQTKLSCLSGSAPEIFPNFNHCLSDSPDAANTSMQRQSPDGDLLARSGNGSARNGRSFSRSHHTQEPLRGSSPTQRTDKPRVLIVH